MDRLRLVGLALVLGAHLAACAEDGAGAGPVDAGDDAVIAPDAAVDATPLLDAAPPAQCADGRDNDGDGLVDGQDPGCDDASDDDERNPAAPPPACSNGVDDDEDTYIDYPRDPGCASDLDDDEGDEPPRRPPCDDGIDNDRDGLIDLADPGCEHQGTPRENDPAEPPACSNGVDDDGDGLIDLPFDLGCSSAGDEDETDPDGAPACANGEDDDLDGLADYPEDPGCVGAGDRDETDPPVRPACSDQADNDRDGETDFPADRGCDSAADGSEWGSCGRTYDPVELVPDAKYVGDTRQGVFESRGSCGGGGARERVFVYYLDRNLESLEITTAHPETEVETAIYVRRTDCLDRESEVACGRETLDGEPGNTLVVDHPTAGTYFIFVDSATGEGGPFAVSLRETPLAQCLNGIDDDGDGRSDYPADPGCYARDDRDETDPEMPPVCADGEDNDGDGLVDWPEDQGCRAAGDGDEVDLCGQGVRFEEYPLGRPFVIGDVAEGTQALSGSCGGGGNEVIYRYENRFNARLRFSIDHEETAQNLVLYVRGEACDDPGAELGCATLQQRMPGGGAVRIDRASVGDYFVVIDSQFGQGGAYKLSVEVERLPPGCSDGVDNDEDGFFDGDDLGCESANDEDERDPPEGVAAPVCFNQADDDGDGLVDFPFDPGCATKGDFDETDPDEPPACANGIDDDEDGLADFPLDAGCQARGDDDERNVAPAPQCGSRIDDDSDGLVDYPFDPGCVAAGDRSERDQDPDPLCANRLDDDRDGWVDFPFDPGCEAAGDWTEDDPEEAPICADGVDNDGDGVADFPLDIGCAHAADSSEEDPAFPPACANGVDDDRDGRTDYPADLDCLGASDTNESTTGRAPRACADGRDNDGDGLVDHADPGCIDAADDDEADLAAAPWCDDGVDNDGDGLVDWPEDDGCGARGDECEQTGHRRCGDVCLDVRTDAANCGECGNVCDPGVECIDGFCGGRPPFECRLADDIIEVPPEGGVIPVDTNNAPDNYHGRCADRNAPERVLGLFLEEPASVRIETINADYDTALNVREVCDDPETEIACNDDGGQGLMSRIDLPRLEPGLYYIFVTGFSNNRGRTDVRIDINPL